jgi:hypothetical protein
LPVGFAVDSWLAIGIAHVKAERTDACVAAYETLIEKARTSNVHAGPAAVFASDNGRRVVTMVGLPGHDEFRHLAAAWDDHHRNAQHRVIAESVSFTLYRVAAGIAAADIDPASHDAYVYEHLDRSAPGASALFSSLGDSPNFRGAAVFSDDGATATVILSRFAHLADYDDFRGSPAATNALGSRSAAGESSFAAHPRKTFALHPD